jgi:hypothetical protein
MVTGSDSPYIISKEGFDAGLRANAHLSVLADRDAFSWAVIERNTAVCVEVGRVSLVDSAPDTALSHERVAHSLRAQPYQSYTLAVRGVPHTLVPKHLFREASASKLLAFATGFQCDHPRHNPVPALDAFIVYGIDARHASLIEQLPVSRVFHNGALVIEAMMRRLPAGTNVCLVDLSDRFIDVYVVAKQQFVLFNTFPIASAEDALYHTVNTLKHLAISPEDTALKVTGDIAVEGASFKLFKTYFADVSIHFGFTMPKVDLALGSVRKQAFMSLLNQFQCVS